MKLFTFLKWFFTLAVCTTVCAALSPHAQRDLKAARRRPRSSEKIDINSATVGQLESLTHIGTKTAQAIIAHRTRHGPFKEAGDLTRVRGIGEKIFEELKKQITLEAGTSPRAGNKKGNKKTALHDPGHIPV